METSILRKLFFQSLLLLLCNIVSFIYVAASCTPGPSLSTTCEHGCFYDVVTGFCQLCSPFKNQAKLLCPELSDTTTIKTTVGSTLPVTLPEELMIPLQGWAIPVIVISIVLLVITVMLIVYREWWWKIFQKVRHTENNEHEQNHQVAPERENMIPFPVQETQRDLSLV